MPLKKANMKLLAKFKKRIANLQRREKQTKLKLRHAIAKVKKLSQSYKKQLTKTEKATQAKVAAAEKAVYSRLVKTISKESKKKKAAPKRKSVKRAAKKPAKKKRKPN